MDGRPVKEDGRLVGVDATDVVKQANASARALLDRAPPPQSQARIDGKTSR